LKIWRTVGTQMDSWSMIPFDPAANLMITNSIWRKSTECHWVSWGRIHCTLPNHCLLSDTPYMHRFATFLATFSRGLRQSKSRELIWQSSIHPNL